MAFPVGYPRVEAAKARLRAALLPLPAVAKVQVIFAADTLRMYGMEPDDVVAVVNDAFDVGVVDVGYAVLLNKTPLFMTVIREVAGGRHCIADVAPRRHGPREAVELAVQAIAVVPDVVEILKSR